MIRIKIQRLMIEQDLKIKAQSGTFMLFNKFRDESAEKPLKSPSPEILDHRPITYTDDDDALK